MKKVNWIGEERMIPGYGMGIKGEEKVLPVNIADSFIEQGLAEEVKPKRVNVKKGDS